MADAQAKCLVADRIRIHANEEYERKHWANALGVSAPEFLALVEKHGVMAADNRSRYRPYHFVYRWVRSRRL